MSRYHLRIPATSANLGPGFDALGLAMGLYLDIEAEPAAEFVIEATGRDAELCAKLDRNLILTTYHHLLGLRHKPIVKLRLILRNEIPLGMGCGSSAAALLAGVLLANHFGELHMSSQQILEEACRREGHPDNVAAAWLGGMTASAMVGSHVIATACGEELKWRLLIAMPKASLATEKARALLPESYSRADAVANVQSTALLVAAFALDRPELLRTAMQDRIHQPYRMAACPLLPKLLPMQKSKGVYGVALSGAGPSVLVIADPSVPTESLVTAMRETSGDAALEVVETHVSLGGAGFSGF